MSTREKVYIAGTARTPIGSFLGSLKNLSAPELGAEAIHASIRKCLGVPTESSWIMNLHNLINKEAINYINMGNVYSAGTGQAPARQATIFAGIPAHTIQARTINKVCGSGLDAVLLATQAIQAGDAKIIIAGGMENMSQASYLLKRSLVNKKMGEAKLTDLNISADNPAVIEDSLIFDGLWDIYNRTHMGNCGELCANFHKITRDEQDAYAITSYERAMAAWRDGRFKNEVFPVIENPKFVVKNDGPIILSEDEELKKFNKDKLKTMKPAFAENGTITAANASKISDGAASMIVFSESALKEFPFLKPEAEILEWSVAAHSPEWFTTAPISAINKLQTWKRNKNAIDLFEINEAFAPVVLVAQKKLEIPAEKINVSGGAIALGHPLGASGARILVTLVNNLKWHKKQLGIAAICIGGGEAIAMAIKNLE